MNLFSDYFLFLFLQMALVIDCAAKQKVSLLVFTLKLHN